MIATAPGKLLLTGEYAVLEGAPALVVAVNRRVVARRRSGATGSSPFLIAVADELARRFGGDHPATRAAFEIVVDSSEFFVGSAKIGLGSSAAVTVAATALALAAQRNAVPMIDRDTVLSIALAAHKAAQTSRRRARDSGSHMIVRPRARASTEEIPIGSTSRDSAARIVAGPISSGTSGSPSAQRGGSGADVAAAVHGGVIAFSLKDTPEGKVTRLNWPSRLQLIPFFTGESADTAELISRIMEARETRSSSVDAALAAIARASEVACEGAAVTSPERAANSVLAALRQATHATEQLARAAGVELIPPSVAMAQRAMAKLGGIAKTTGAGGGDVAVAVIPGSEDPSVAERLLVEVGCQPLRARVDVIGVDLQADAQ